MSKEAAALPPRRIVPAHEADYQAVHNLRRVGPESILAELDALLEWTQDGNWPVARGVGEVLAQHFSAIRPALLQILRGPDAGWKYFFWAWWLGRCCGRTTTRKSCRSCAVSRSGPRPRSSKRKPLRGPGSCWPSWACSPIRRFGGGLGLRST